MKKILLWCAVLPAVQAQAATQTAQSEWRRYQRAVKQKKHYEADGYAKSACHRAASLAEARKYCPTALSRSASWTSGACFAIETHHKMCEMGSRQACLDAAQMNRQGWRGLTKEPCPNQET